MLRGARVQLIRGFRHTKDRPDLSADGAWRLPDGGTLEVSAGQAVLAKAGERVRYSTPGGARYVAICLPAFSYDLVHREND